MELDQLELCLHLDECFKGELLSKNVSPRQMQQSCCRPLAAQPAVPSSLEAGEQASKARTIKVKGTNHNRPSEDAGGFAHRPVYSGKNNRSHHNNFCSVEK